MFWPERGPELPETAAPQSGQNFDSAEISLPHALQIIVFLLQHYCASILPYAWMKYIVPNYRKYKQFSVR
jgi:hypothetical protein